MKRITIFNILMFLLIQFSLELSAKDYYISNAGSDKAKGTSPEISFRTIERVNQIKLKPGDKVFFKAGESFTGTLKINNSGKEGKPIVISSYGEGDKPIINGGLALRNFTPVEDNIYTTACDKNVKYLYNGDELYILARYPNTGYLEMDEAGENSLVDTDLPFSENQLTGATAYVDIRVWITKKTTISTNSKIKLDFATPVHFKSTSGKTIVPLSGLNYFLDNKKIFLDHNKEWYYAAGENKMYVYSEQAIDKNTVLQGAYRKNGIVIAQGVSHVKIENIKLSGQTESGIIGLGDNGYIDIRNTEFTKIGKYGIYFAQHPSNLSFSNNYIHNVCGNAIRIMHAHNSIIEGNRIEKIGKIFGYGINGLNNAAGICVLNYEKKYDDTLKLTHTNTIKNNYIDDIGYHGIRLEGYNNVCEKNIIKNCVNTLHDGGWIYIWGVDTMSTFNNVIRDNIVIGGKALAEGSHHIQIGIYVDNNVRDITVENNIVANIKGGMSTNWATTRTTFSNNLVFGGETALNITVLNEKCFANHSAVENVLVINKNRGKTIVLANHRGTQLQTGEINNNTHVAPREKFHIRTIRVDVEEKGVKWLTLKGWQEKMGLGTNSIHFKPEKNNTVYPMNDIFINESDIPKTFTLDSKHEYIDIEGNTLSNNITLEARKAKVVFYKGK